MKMLVGFVLGVVLVSGPVVFADNRTQPDPHGCGALVDLVLTQYDRAYSAEQALYRTPPRVFAAQIALVRIDSTWKRFWQLAQRCSPNH